MRTRLRSSASFQRLRDQQVCAAEIGHLEAARQHADDGGGSSIEDDGAAKHTGISSEPGLPQRPTQQRDARRAGPVLCGGEVAAEKRLYAQSGQECGLHAHAGSAQRLAVREIAIGASCGGGD
jgi:hypothetical protein